MHKRPGGDGKSYSYGWEIDHIRPKSDFKNESDAHIYNNYELCSEIIIAKKRKTIFNLQYMAKHIPLLSAKYVQKQSSWLWNN